MQNREEAVRWFQERGFHAFLRDWALGETVGVATQAIEGPDGMIVFDHMVYLYPIEGGGWAVADLSAHEDLICEDLQHASQVACERLVSVHSRHDAC